jgi:hypothetical protein
MADLTNPKLIYAKGFLFLLVGVLSSALLLLECPSLRVGLLLAVAVWAFARFYYFAFYVIEHYVDPGFRFAGLWSFARYLLGKRRPAGQPPRANPDPAPERERADVEDRPAN